MPTTAPSRQATGSTGWTWAMPVRRQSITRVLDTVVDELRGGARPTRDDLRAVLTVVDRILVLVWRRYAEQIRTRHLERNPAVYLRLSQADNAVARAWDAVEQGGDVREDVEHLTVVLPEVRSSWQLLEGEEPARAEGLPQDELCAVCRGVEQAVRHVTDVADLEDCIRALEPVVIELPSQLAEISTTGDATAASGRGDLRRLALAQTEMMLDGARAACHTRDVERGRWLLWDAVQSAREVLSALRA